MIPLAAYTNLKSVPVAEVTMPNAYANCFCHTPLCQFHAPFDLQVRALQREIMEGQDTLGQKQFEVNQLQKEVESLTHRLSDKSKDLAARKEVSAYFKTQLPFLP